MIETITILDNTISLYYSFWFLGMVANIVAALLFSKEYGISHSKAIIYISLVSCIGVLLMALTSWVCGGGKMAGMNFVRIVPLAWLYFLSSAYLLKDPYQKMMDYLTLTSVWFYVIAHIGCIFPGCCHGYPSEWGIYSNTVGYRCFPVQIIEVLINIIINCLLLWMRKQNRFQGMLYPWYLIMFGSTRIVTELFRDNKKLFWGLSELSLHALISVVLGTLVLIILHCRKEKSAYNEKNKL